MNNPLRLRIGHSPDPDDAFLFYAMTQGKIPLRGMQVEHRLEGIEQLNQRALQGELEMTAISLHAYSYVADRYVLLTTGASVGEGYGPVVVAKEPLKPEQLRHLRVAVPGKLTTAVLLLELAVGKVEQVVLAFDQILTAVEQGQVPAGLLIHEGQITYQKHGLQKVIDLGEWWKHQKKLPVPLGVNVVRRDLGPAGLRQVAEVFKESLDYAFAHRAQALAYAMRYGRGLDPASTDRFVGMYVNRWSVDCRPEAAVAMQQLLDEAAQKGLTPRSVQLEFVED